ncbi:MAG: Microcin self-immunity protein MccF [Patescibacteria group bacterium]|nr:Microcin self-immunity protein MccF [Patescibacteria group bacterium]
MDAALRGYVDGFLKFFTQEGYVRLPAVPLNSRVDPSVLFIGSHVSVFKPYFLGDEIPGNGICMHQPCLRTWNAKKAFEDSLIPAW